MTGWISRLRDQHIRGRATFWVSEMLDDPSSAAAEAQRWLAKSPAHRKAYREIATEIGRASDNADQAELHHIADCAERGLHKSARTQRIALTGSVAAIATIGSIGLYASIDHRALPPAEQQHAISTSVEARSKATDAPFVLPDGSEVSAPEGTRYRVDYNGRERGIRLFSGVARFKVQHGSDLPFIVYAGGGSVTATGTEFEVRSDRAVAVRLISGTVKVAIPGRATTGSVKTISMRSGEQLAFEPVGRSSAPLGQFSVSATRKVFDDVPLSVVIAAANRGSPVRIVVTDPEIAGRHVFAEIDVSDAGRVADRLARLFDLAIDHQTPGEIRLEPKKRKSVVKKLPRFARSPV